MGWHMTEGMDWIWPMGVGMLIWVVVLVAVIGGVVWLLNRTRSQPPGPGGNSAEEILRNRFAAGEIDAEEYQQRMAALRR